MPNLSDAFLAFGLALVATWISTPVVKSLAWRIGAIDEPRTRGLHQFRAFRPKRVDNGEFIKAAADAGTSQRGGDRHDDQHGQYPSR